MTRAALIVMAKRPQPGFTKTRLCPPFTSVEAANFYEALLQDTFSLASRIPNIQLAAAITPPGSSAYFKSITPPGTLLIPVEGADIGICLENAVRALFEHEYPAVLALNADGPSLPLEYLQQALQLLDSHDVVFGPSEDGGYYLVGLKSLHVKIFRDIQWSTPHVMQQTLIQAERLGLDFAQTPPWYDIDLPADVERVRAELDHLPFETLCYTRRFFESQDREEGSK